jgi:hypothetical protein
MRPQRPEPVPAQRFGLSKPRTSDYPIGMSGGCLRSGGFCLAALVALAGCTVEMPSFLGREGNGSGEFSMRPEPAPDPIQVALREASLERSLHGVILRVAGEAPTWGFYTAQLRPLDGGAPDAAGIVTFELVAVPPQGAEPAGPERSRLLTAAIFMPTLALKDLRGLRVSGGGTVQTLTLPRV